MAIDKEMLKTRALTALVFVLIMLAGLFINVWSFIILFTIVMFGCLYEYFKIAKLINYKNFLLFLPLSFFYIILPIMMLINLGTDPPHLKNNGAYSILIPCAIVFSIWINDTMAYIVGSIAGKTPLSKISPKKTMEGTIGGIVLCIAVIAIGGSMIPLAKHINVGHWIMIAAICGIFGTIGDLIESKLKRMAHIKDSGSMMPGHGGFLDRFDSLLLATPIVWLYCKLML
ncbi:MAG TPA: phosphatidate cytidylyltransferase [Ferruginibacter sp.]|nr:phosphatidate cytidylyltransferase [Ferruginibacter sp.]